METMIMFGIVFAKGIMASMVIALCCAAMVCLGIAVLGLAVFFFHGEEIERDLRRQQEQRYQADRSVVMALAGVCDKLWHLEASLRDSGVIPADAPVSTWKKCPHGPDKGVGINEFSWENRIIQEQQEQQQEAPTL
jgi:hypothetical protein